MRTRNPRFYDEQQSLEKLVLTFSVQITGSDEKLASLVSLLVLTFQPKVPYLHFFRMVFRIF
jgi:hypothetical protein